MLIDHEGNIVAHAYREFTQHYPAPGRVEHDAEEIWQTALSVMQDALTASPDWRPVALGIANQRETCLFWDRRSGRPLHRAIVWQCRRSAAICDELREQGLEPEIQRRTGLRLDPYFSGTKSLWLRRNDESLAGRIRGGDVLFGTVDSWLVYRLSGGQSHVTDTTNASRTLGLDLETLAWDQGLLELFGLTPAVMPRVLPSASQFGVTRAAGALPEGLPIAGLAGDQQAALFGQACFSAGQTKATYGTGCFILTHSGRRSVFSSKGLITTVAASFDSSPTYALEGSIFVAGAALQWCRDNLGLVRDWREGEELASTVPDAAGVVFVPAFVGLGSPYWGPEVRGAVYGLTQGTLPAHIVRAALDAIVYQAQDVLAVVAEESGVRAQELRVDGGAAANDSLMQLQADLSGLPVSRPRAVESTAIGAAFLAGLSVGFWQSEDEIASLRREERRFVPSKTTATAQEGYERWRQAIQGLLQTNLKPAAERDPDA